MRLRNLAALLLAAPALMAQYQHLSTDRHGRVLLFSTVLTLQGEERNDYPKLLRVETGAVSTLRSLAPQISPGARAPSNFPELVAPELSSDGTRYAYTGRRWCVGGSGCINVERLQGNVSAADGESLSGWTGRARLSANGRWAVFSGANALVQPNRFVRVNLETNEVELPRIGDALPEATGRRVVASDGTAAWVSFHSLSYFTPDGGVRTIDLPFDAAFATIADDGGFAVVETQGPAPSLWIVDLLARAVLPAVAAIEGCRQPALSEDGATLMFVSGANWEARNDTLAPQVWLMDLPSGRLKQVTAEADGIAEATISGDAQVVWAATRTGRLLRVDVASGGVEEVIAATPWASNDDVYAYAPGSRYTLRGSGMNVARVKVGEQEASILYAGAERVEFLLPWGAELGVARIELGAPDSLFQPQLLAKLIRETAPMFETWGSLPMIWHEGGWTAVYAGDPARGGEAIEVRMSGLGPVDARGNTTAPLVWELIEGAGGTPMGLGVLSSVLEENEAGFYRVKLRLPPRLGGAWTQLLCRDARDIDASAIAVLAVPPE